MRIEVLKKRFKDEWLLIRVTAVDDQDQPIEGEIVAHSKDRDEIYEAQRRLKGDLYITYSGEMPKKGYAVAFYG
ncbi:MAG: hypothetical protein AB1478_11825 [Nitrospirota bacterium]